MAEAPVSTGGWPGLYRELLLTFGNPGAALSASLDALMALPRMDRETALAIQNPDETWVASEIIAAEREENPIMTLEDSRYPSLFREIHAPPPILFIKGSPRDLEGFLCGRGRGEDSQRIREEDCADADFGSR